MVRMIHRLVILAGLAFLPCLAHAQAKVDADLYDYQKTSGVSGNLSSVGSDTLANLMTLWAEEFKRVYPNVNVQIQAAGSSTAPPATCTWAPTARAGIWTARPTSGPTNGTSAGP